MKINSYLSAFLLVLSGIRLGCANELPAQTSSDNDYSAMERTCIENSCCLASVRKMKASHGFRIEKMNSGCPANYHPNMLKCINTYVWGEPTKNSDFK